MDGIDRLARTVLSVGIRKNVNPKHRKRIREVILGDPSYIKAIDSIRVGVDAMITAEQKKIDEETSKVLEKRKEK